MNWLILFLILISILFVYIYERSKLSKKQKRIFSILSGEHMFQFIIGIFITTIGVLLAITFTNMDSKKNEVDKTIALLQVSDKEIVKVQENIEELYLPMYDADIDYMNFIKKNPIQFPISINDILKNDTVLINMSSASYGNLIDAVRSLNSAQFYINDSSGEKELYQWIDVVNRTLKAMHEIIRSETQYLYGEINMEELEQKHQITIKTIMFPDGQAPDIIEELLTP